MKRHRVLAGSAVVLSMMLGSMTGRAIAGQTPTLGDVAKKEAERRKAQPPAAAKVYTNKDLPESAQKPATKAAPPAEGSAPADPVAVATEQKAADAKVPADKPQGDQKDEAYWKKRMADAREDLRRNEMFADALQSRVNSLNRDFSSRDNPTQRSRIGEDRTEALNELTRVKGEVERARKQIADIEDEARKAGIPAGWLR
jgi:hypothetical protein